MSRDWIQANALRGLSPRTARLLDRQAWFEGTNYDHLRPWEPFVGPLSDESGHECVRYIPKRLRAPAVQLGFVAEKVTRLRQELNGSKRWPTIKVASNADKWEQLGAREAMTLPVQDLALKGSGVVGFMVGPNGQLSSRYLETEWCTPVFTAQRHSAEAAAIAKWFRQVLPPDELAKLRLPPEPATLTDPALPAPEMGPELDLCFLRQQWRRDEDVPDGHTTRRVIRWYRRDYLPHLTIEYEPIEVHEGADRVPDWQPVLPLRPHDFGVVPFVWMRPEGTAPGETEGPPLISEQFLTVAKTADYAETFRASAYEYHAFPRVWMHNTKLVDEFNSNASGRTNRNFPQGDPGAMLRTTGQDSVVQLLESSGAAITTGVEQVGKLRDHADRQSGLREFDQTESAGTLSGVALERMMAPTVSVIRSYRETVEQDLQLLWAKALWALRQRSASPKMTFGWPRVVEITAEDADRWATVFAALRASRLLSHETAVERMCGVLGIEDVKGELQRLEADQPMVPPGFGGNPDDDDPDDGE